MQQNSSASTSIKKALSESNLLQEESRTHARPESESEKVIRDFSDLLIESVQSAIDSANSEEVLLVLPIEQHAPGPSCRSQERNPFNLRIKDELRIDLKKCPESSSTSLISIRRNRIYPIEEVSESTTNVADEEMVANQIALIIAESQQRAAQRPQTRRSHWIEFEEPFQEIIPVIEVRPTVSKCFSSCYAIQRFLSEEDLPPETTDYERLLDEVSQRPAYGSITDSERALSFSSMAQGGCCVVKAFRKLGKMCLVSNKKKRK